MGEGKSHVFTLVQLLRRDDAVLLSIQIAGKTFHRDMTCMNAAQHTDMTVKAQSLKAYLVQTFPLNPVPVDLKEKSGNVLFFSPSVNKSHKKSKTHNKYI